MSFAAQLESGPLHEAEEQTIMGSTHTANVELSSHIVKKVGLPGTTKQNGTESKWATGVEPKFAGTHNLLRNKQSEQVRAPDHLRLQCKLHS